MALGLGCVLRGEQDTSAAILGSVCDMGTKTSVAEARVVAAYLPTAGRYSAKTNSQGLVLFSGLPVGGPYVLTVEVAGFEATTLSGFALGLGEVREFKIMLKPVSSDIVYLEKVEVVASRSEASPAGAGLPTNLSRQEMEDQPSIEGSLNEFAARDPRVVYVDAERGELAAAGQNSRFNSLSVDGVNINDQFGVTPSGFPSQGNPLSLETVEAVNVEVSPYEVSRGGFTGASINAVTRSGSNVFKGSVYGYYRNQNMRAAHPLTHERDPFTDETHGFTLGGPLWRNHLFFYVGYEHAQRTEPAPDAGFEPSSFALARIASASAGYGYDPGALLNPGQQNKQDNKYLAKLEWRINDRHRMVLRYSETQGHQPIFPDYTTSGRVSLSGHWYDSTQNLRAWSAQVFSQWTDAFQSEIKVASHRYESQRDPRTRFPQAEIKGVPSEEGGVGYVFIGAEESSQLNALNVLNHQASGKCTWLLGRHRLMLGAEVESSDFKNTFLQNAWGSYEFASISAYETGKPSKFTYQYMLPDHSPEVAWGYAVGSAFLQDTWEALPRLTLTAGMRVDAAETSSAPHRNPLVEQVFGRRNDHTIDGDSVFGPRASFVLKLDDKKRTRLKGGAGLFQGRAPGVWLSNTYSNDGFASLVNTTINGFSPDPDNQPKGNPATARQRVDLLDEGFRLPEVARANVGFVHTFPWQELEFSAELMRSWTLQGLSYKNINLRRTGTGPDGRAIYGDRTKSFGLVSNSQYQSASFTDVYLLTNTQKGEATQATLSLKRPLRKHWGASLSYTRSSAEEVSPVTSSTAATNYSTRASLDPNDDHLGTSNYAIRDRVLASLTLKFALIKRFDTRITLQYEGRSGRPYSYVSGTDVNGDSVDYDNDLLYVPASRDDLSVRWADAKQADAYFAWYDNQPTLKRFAGRVVPRNSERSSFQHTFDMKFSQDFPLRGRLKVQAFLDILNVANLLNEHWGRVYAVGFPYTRPVINASYDPVAGQYVYRFTGVKDETLQAARSRWQMQGGVRVKF